MGPDAEGAALPFCLPLDLTLQVACMVFTCCLKYRYILEKGNVALVPGDAFGAPACLRLSYAASLDTLQKGLDRIEAALTSAALHRPALANTL